MPLCPLQKRAADSLLWARRLGDIDRTGVNPAGDAGDTPNILVGGTSTGISTPILLRTFGYSRPILVALRSLSLKPISFGYKTPPIRVFPSHTSPHSVVDATDRSIAARPAPQQHGTAAQCAAANAGSATFSAYIGG